jgi:hypothetical protein
VAHATFDTPLTPRLRTCQIALETLSRGGRFTTATNKEIGRKIRRSPRTVEDQLAALEALGMIVRHLDAARRRTVEILRFLHEVDDTIDGPPAPASLPPKPAPPAQKSAAPAPEPAALLKEDVVRDERHVDANVPPPREDQGAPPAPLPAEAVAALGVLTPLEQVIVAAVGRPDGPPPRALAESVCGELRSWDFFDFILRVLTLVLAGKEPVARFLSAIRKARAPGLKVRDRGALFFSRWAAWVPAVDLGRATRETALRAAAAQRRSANGSPPQARDVEAEALRLKAAWVGLPETERAAIEADVRARNPGLARWPKLIEPLCLAGVEARPGRGELPAPDGATPASRLAVGA